MPRVIVTDDGFEPMMDEYVIPDHLRDDHSAGQLMERLAWAINDAHERVAPRRRKRRPRTSTDYRQVARS